MSYRRLFIMRKDLHMSPGKLAAQVAHCAEAYWTNRIRTLATKVPGSRNGFYEYQDLFEKELFEEYIDGRFVKTICEAKNKNQLLKAKTMANELGLVEGIGYGLI